MLRSVLNVDIAAFPIAVERVIDRGLRDRPVLVAPPGSVRAPVLVVSQEAAREGVRAGMPLPVALRRCPGGRSAALLADAAPGRLRGARRAAALGGARDRRLAGPAAGGGRGGRRGGDARRGLERGGGAAAGALRSVRAGGDAAAAAQGTGRRAAG